jgi:nicotinate-nucleotide adenylyltransferase
MRIGLLGGSFNPAHPGHRHVIDIARQRLKLDQVWLLVSPGNPLKPGRGMAPFEQRLASARALADGRRVIASGIEAALGTRYTIDTLRLLLRGFPRVHFVWLMGADILEQLPRWRRWLEFVRRIPIAVLPRPSYNHRALSSLAAQRLMRWRRRETAAAVLSELAAPAWIFLCVPQHAASASAIRAKEERHSQDTKAFLARPASRGAAQEGRQAHFARSRQGPRHAAQEDDRCGA